MRVQADVIDELRPQRLAVLADCRYDVKVSGIGVPPFAKRIVRHDKSFG
jgi:hypothetical protein